MSKTGIAALLALAIFSGLAAAADIVGNPGGIYTAKLAFKKADTKSTASATEVQSGHNLGAGVAPTTTSTAWNDPSVNPANPAGDDFSQGYGSTADSEWFLVDLNRLKTQGLGNVWVQITVKRADNAGNDLVPALTVWNGNLDGDALDAWYPNTFQTSAGFSSKLTALANNTAYGTSNAAMVTSKIKLKKGKKNYLTVALGGDARNATDKHSVGFLLQVKVSKKKPSTTSIGVGDTGTDGGTGTGYDSYGCKIGQTCYHPQMGHCMAVATCEDTQYAGQCLCSK